MSLDINLTGIQSIPIVVNANITAENNKVYHVIANATFTDPTPVEGRGYVVLLRNGVATIGGVSNGNLGTIFYRIFRGASWVTYIHYDLIALQSVFVPPSRTINGLDLSANRTLTTADINDSSNKRYVTDANLTVIGNTSNTNTGDETQASILSKLGFFVSNRVAESTAVTGTTTETIIDSTLIPANTYLSGGILYLENSMFRKVGTAGAFAVRAYIGTNSSSLTGATVIMTVTGIGSTNLYAEFLRTFTCTTTALVGLNSSSNTATDIVASTSARQSTTVDWTVNQYIHFTVALSNSADSVTMIGNTIKNF